MKAQTCEIRDCGREASGAVNGIECCDRCEREFVSIGMGAVYFEGRWHGVRGAIYSSQEAGEFPGLIAAGGE